MVIRRAPRHENITLRGLRHRLSWWGERAAAPVVLLHGWMDTGDTWQFLADCLPDDWCLVAPDWRGFGGTEWPADGYWFADYFADLEALLDAVCPGEPARLIAHSMGGNVATMYAGIRPHRVRWIVNLEGIGLPRTGAEQAPGRYAEWLDALQAPSRPRRYGSLNVLVEFLLSRNPCMQRERAEFLAQAWCRQDGDGFTLAFDPRHRHVSPVLYRREEAEACWRNCIAPVLLLLGEHSEIRQRVGADGREESMRRMFRDIRVVDLPGVGHMMHVEDPDSIARHVLEFARALPER
jgi:pimeloyl-ACP methyl ester carboxylesterase